MASVTDPHPPTTTLDPATKTKKRLSDGLVPETKELHTDHHDHDHQHEELIFDDRNSIGQKLIILGTVVFPLLGMATAIVLAWQFGMMSWWNLTMLIGGWYLTGMGITIGYHRMLTHRSFDAVPAVRWFWTVMGALAVEGSPIDWCMVHRKHHQFSDHTMATLTHLTCMARDTGT